jgi:hypothetical protein
MLFKPTLMQCPATAVAWARARRKSSITSIVVWFASDSEKTGNEVGNDQDTRG